MLKQPLRATVVLATLALAACGDSTGPGQEQELISRVTLTLTRVGGGTPQVVYIDDADGLGPAAPSAQVGTLTLVRGSTYTGSVLFENRLVSPPENITTEVQAESDEHMVIYTIAGGAGVTVITTDTDGAGKQVGLAYTVAAAADAPVGARTLRAVLCHYGSSPKPTTASTCTVDTDVDLTFNAVVTAPVAVMAVQR